MLARLIVVYQNKKQYVIIFYSFAFIITSAIILFHVKSTVTSRFFTHIVSTEKVRNDMRDRKDSRGIKYTYYIGFFFDIASS